MTRPEDPQSAQIAAHEAYLQRLGELEHARALGDAAAVRRLRPLVEPAKRRWHQWVRAAQSAMRETRH